MIRLFFILTLCFATAVRAENIVLGMNHDEVQITANFDGSEILIFGAIKRDAPQPDGKLGVIVTIVGPNERVKVRRKERKFGIWMNTDEIEVDAAPSFYAVSTSMPWQEIISDNEDLRHRISIPRAIRAVDTRVTDTELFNDALKRIRETQGKFGIYENGVLLDQNTLFQTRIPMPANLTAGEYKTKIYLTRDRAVVSSFETTIDVRKVGMEDFLYTLAHEKPFLYALLSLVIAVVAGWGASSFFRMLRTQ